jgi:hypothetical protein
MSNEPPQDGYADAPRSSTGERPAKTDLIKFDYSKRRALNNQLLPTFKMLGFLRF